MSADRNPASLSLVVPLYNEARRLPKYVDELLVFASKLPEGSELIFVDDGSTDDTLAVLERALAPSDHVRTTVLHRPHEGKGAALRAGLEQASASLAGFCDLDLSTPLRDLEHLAEVARDTPVLAIASRDLPGSELVQAQSRVREFLGKSYNRFVQLALVPGIVDTQCGAKVARTSVWRRVLPHCAETGFAWDLEAIAVARALGITVREIPVSWRHDADSQVHVARDGMRMLAAVPRIARHVHGVRPAIDDTNDSSEVFEDDQAADLAESDSSHWWFRGKARLVGAALRRPRAAAGWLVDVGGGAGGVTAQLGWDPDRTLVVDGNRELTSHATARHGIAAVTANVSSLPLADHSASVVCFLDVLEHLAEPAAALAEARRVLQPDGRLIVTVPAHQWLWSAADDALGHKRRYTRGMARRELRAAGFRVRFTSHEFSYLVAPVWLKRRARPGAGAELGLDVTSRRVTLAADALTTFETALVARVPLPFGTSILCVAEPIS